MKSAVMGLAACLAVGVAGATWAQDLNVAEKNRDTLVGFEPSGKYSNYTLTITGPNGFQASVSSKTDAPSIDLRRFGTFDDGIYHYQLTASTDEKVPVRNELDNGRDGAGSRLKSVAKSGQFQVKDRIWRAVLTFRFRRARRLPDGPRRARRTCCPSEWIVRRGEDPC